MTGDAEVTELLPACQQLGSKRRQGRLSVLIWQRQLGLLPVCPSLARNRQGSNGTPNFPQRDFWLVLRDSLLQNVCSLVLAARI